jgi:hypothetical protein
MRPELVAPRRLLTCEVRVTMILDLRTTENQATVGLTVENLMSRVGDYAACHGVGQAAHQLGLHGILAPAATGLGETLALFERHLPENELPVLREVDQWEQLPADPRQPRLVEPSDTR